MAKRRHPDRSCEVFLERAARPDDASSVNALVAGLKALNAQGLRLQWRNHLGGVPPAHLPRWLLMNLLAYRIQAAALGGLDKATLSVIHQPRGAAPESSCGGPFEIRAASTRDGIALKPGAMLAREWRGKERVTVLDKGFAWNGKTYGSLSQIAKTITGTNWNGHRFFGLRTPKPGSLGRATSRRQDGAALSEPDGAPVGPDPSNAPFSAAEEAGRPRSSGHCADVRPIGRAATNLNGRHRDATRASR
jgi:Protein of unknown function (DUF2924)